MSNVSERFYENEIGEQIFTKVWKPQVDREIDLIFLHGFGEHMDRYNNLFNQFNNCGITVYSFDQSGHGNTGFKNNAVGVGSGFNSLLKDCDDIVNRTFDENRNLILMGHSWGGTVVLNYMALGMSRQKVFACIVASPTLHIHKSTSSMFKLGLVKFMANFYPDMSSNLNLDSKKLVNCEFEMSKLKNDPFILQSATVKEIVDLNTEGKNLLELRYLKIKVKNMLIVHGDGDKFANFDSTQLLVNKLKKLNLVRNLTFKLFRNGSHELHNDKAKEEVINYYLDWIFKVHLKFDKTLNGQAQVYKDNVSMVSTKTSLI